MGEYYLIASIIGSGINGNQQSPRFVRWLVILLSLLLLEVELMETVRVLSNEKHLYQRIASIIGSGINGNLALVYRTSNSTPLENHRFYYWKWN